jgi:hypothetical protein
MNLSQKILAVGQELERSGPDQISHRMCVAFDDLVGQSFRAESLKLVDTTGACSPAFGVVLYKTDAKTVDCAVAADNAAVAIDICDHLDLATLQEAYARVGAAKRLAKSPVRRGEERSTITLGILFACTSSMSLEAIADELYRLNCDANHRYWPDMIVVRSVGIINYAVQFPGEPASGDFLPPASNAFDNGVPPIYIVIVMRSMGDYYLNKMIAFVVGHLHVFSPDASVRSLNWMDILEGASTSAVTALGFQPTLRGQIVPVPREEYNDRIMPLQSAVIEDRSGTPLGSVTYRRWQDGAIILLAGPLPLSGLLLFLPNIGSMNLSTIRRDNLQLSYVLPLSIIEFQTFLDSLQRRSNFVVKKNGGGFVVQKLMDEGAGTPFIARCWLGILRLRENLYPGKADRDAFDKIFQALLSSVMAARASSRNAKTIWQSHAAKLASGEIVRIDGGNIHILESVDRDLATEVETLLNTSVRSIKTGLQNLGNYLNTDIGFLFKKKAAFEVGIERLRKIDVALADYLQNVRVWTEPLVQSRNDLEHDLWEVPKIRYENIGGAVTANEPIIAGQAVTEFVEHYVDRVMCFVEEFTVHLIQAKLPQGVAVTEVLPNDRSADSPERFRLTPDAGGANPWQLQYQPMRFEQL